MAQLFLFLFVLSSSFFMTLASHAEPAKSFVLSSSSFADRGDIPALYSCDGRNLSPELSWKEAPAKTQAFAVICHDPDAPGGPWYHWVVYNLPAGVSELAEGAVLPVGAVLGKNSWGKTQYNGPCPPHSSVHHYIFTLYALDVPLSLPSGADVAAVKKAMYGHVLEKTMLTGVFGH